MAVFLEKLDKLRKKVLGMVCKQLLKPENGAMVRSFLPAKDEMAPEVVLAEILDLSALENPFAIAEQKDFEEGDRVKNRLSTLGRVGA